MTEPFVLTEIDGRGVATVTLNRPEVHNAFNDAVIARLSDIFGELAGQAGLRAVVLAGRGKSFCAGADLNWMTKMAGYSYKENLDDAKRMAAMFDRLNTLPVPTIAKVQGSAFAGALGLISACDIAVAADHAKFAVTEVRIGLIAAAISPYVIAAIGPGAARRYFQTAERFDAAEAKRLGLLHEVVAADALDETVAGIVGEILRNAPASLAACKTLIRETAGPVTEELRTETATRIAHLRAEPEAREGIAAFFEKRKPAWVAGGNGND
jgi:methylglutaconyl-CoA hydratase